MKIFTKTYTDEDLIDLERDMYETFAEESTNPNIKQVPVDENGFRTGLFLVTVEWIPPTDE